MPRNAQGLPQAHLALLLYFLRQPILYFTVLVNGSSNPKSSFWKLVQHLDPLDTVLVTHMDTNSIPDVNSLLQCMQAGKHISAPGRRGFTSSSHPKWIQCSPKPTWVAASRLMWGEDQVEQIWAHWKGWASCPCPRALGCCCSSPPHSCSACRFCHKHGMQTIPFIDTHYPQPPGWPSPPAILEIIAGACVATPGPSKISVNWEWWKDWPPVQPQEKSDLQTCPGVSWGSMKGAAKGWDPLQGWERCQVPPGM